MRRDRTEVVKPPLTRSDVINRLKAASKTLAEAAAVRVRLGELPPSSTKLWLIQVLDNRMFEINADVEFLTNTVIDMGETP